MKEDKDIIQSFIKLGCKCSNNGYHLYDIQKWLREERNWFIGIELQNQKYSFYSRSVINPNKYFGNILESGGKYIHESPEDALEAGVWAAYYILNN